MAFPNQFSGNAWWKPDFGLDRAPHVSVFNGNNSLGSRHGGCHMVESAEVRLDSNSLESGVLRANASNDGQKMVIGMGAPGVRVGTRWLRRLGPRGQT